MAEQLSQSFFQRDPLHCARDLIGCTFRWKNCSGRIVEAEAYAEHGDEACHTYHRPSAREFVTVKPAGTAYVYLNYGMYWLMNVLCKDPRTGNNGFVLLRALDPVDGIATMKRRREKSKETELCSGPGKLSMALGIGKEDHGKCLTSARTRGFYEKSSEFEILADTRVGISSAKDLKWRFLEKGNPNVSVPFGKVK